MAEEKKFESKNFSDEDLVEATTETIGVQPSQKSLWAQAELQRRQMENIRNFNETTTRYSKVILVLTFVLFIVAVMQLVISILLPVFESLPLPKGLTLGALAVLVVSLISYTLYKTSKDFLE